MAGIVFAASLAGILTRPVGFLAAFWPANALLLGILVRWPRLSSAAGWSGAVAGYLAADLLTGGGWLLTIWLTLGNLAGAVTGVVLFRRLPEEDRHLRRPQSVLSLFAICAATGVAAALVGGGAAPILIGKDWLTGCAFWFTTELVNSILLVPVILTAPDLVEGRHSLVETIRLARNHPVGLMPLLALLVSVIVSLLVGGPGAIAFAVPALLWCALGYNLFSTALLTLLYCAGMLIAVSADVIVIHPGLKDYVLETMSIRLGISLLALGPLTVASVNSTRNELVRSLEHAVSHDFLTGALARRTFMSRGVAFVRTAAAGHQPLAVLMLDVDHFKQINDRYGHAIGDKVLVSFAAVVAAGLRDSDLFGRLGGEEFAAVLTHASGEEALTVAERLRRAVEAEPVVTPEGEVVRMTVSIGVALSAEPPCASLDVLLFDADQSLYRAKAEGRNRVVRGPSERPVTDERPIGESAERSGQA